MNNQISDDPTALPVEELNLGKRLRIVRERAGLSQRELAKRANVTNSTVSQIEQGQHSPSLMSLTKILSAFPISIAEFFTLPVDETPFRIYGQQEMLPVMRGKTELRCMAPERSDKRLQMFIERYEPGGSTGKELIEHHGEAAVYVMSGEIALEVDGILHRVAAGSGFQIFSNIAYRVINYGVDPALLVCAVNPPMF